MGGVVRTNAPVDTDNLQVKELSATNITATAINADTLTTTGAIEAATLNITTSATAVAPSTGSYIRNIGTGTAEASTANCPAGSIWGKYT